MNSNIHTLPKTKNILLYLVRAMSIQFKNKMNLTGEQSESENALAVSEREKVRNRARGRY